MSQDMVTTPPTPSFMAAARYSTVPVLLIAATGIVAVNSYVRRNGGLPHGLPRGLPRRRDGWRHGARPLVAVGVLACVLCFGWVTDFRYVTQRSHAGHWLPYAQRLVTACAQDPRPASP